MYVLEKGLSIIKEGDSELLVLSLSYVSAVDSCLSKKKDLLVASLLREHSHSQIHGVVPRLTERRLSRPKLELGQLCSSDMFDDFVREGVSDCIPLQLSSVDLE